jgi:hypothetical protein
VNAVEREQLITDVPVVCRSDHVASMSVGAAVNAVTDLGYDARLNAHELVGTASRCCISLHVDAISPIQTCFQTKKASIK